MIVPAKWEKLSQKHLKFPTAHNDIFFNDTPHYCNWEILYGLEVYERKTWNFEIGLLFEEKHIGTTWERERVKKSNFMILNNVYWN